MARSCADCTSSDARWFSAHRQVWLCHSCARALFRGLGRARGSRGPASL